MKVVDSKIELKAALSNQGQRRALVPTMGALHEGHLSLIDQAREKVGEDGQVVVTIFVNPTQFGPNEDLGAYPRPLDADLAACRERGVDLVFAPEVGGIYEADASISVGESRLSQGLCGGSRPGHFDGVCLVVAKLFNLVQPDIAVFGEKDYQQLAVIRRMVRDLDFPIEIVGSPTVREKDGLALSSRNAYLSEAEREQAPIIYQAISKADPSKGIAESKCQIKEMIESASLAKLDYLEIVHPDTLEPLVEFDPVEGYRIITAVFFGKTRLIDNVG